MDETKELRIDFLEKNWKMILLFLVLAGFALRWTALWLEPLIDRDSVLYLSMAESWNRTGSFAGVLQEHPGLWVPPMFAALIYGLTQLGLTPESAGALLNIAAGSLLIPLAFLIAAEFTENKTLPLAAALLTACHPVLTELSGQILRDSLNLTLVTFVLYLFLRYLRDFKRSRMIWSALVTGFALHIRFETLEIFVLLGLLELIALLKKKVPWKKAVIDSLLFLCIALLVFLLFHAMMGSTEYIKVLIGRIGIYLDRFCGEVK